MSQDLSLDQHVNSVAHSGFYQLRNIAKIRSAVSLVELEMTAHKTMFRARCHSPALQLSSGFKGFYLLVLSWLISSPPLFSV